VLSKCQVLLKNRLTGSAERIVIRRARIGRKRLGDSDIARLNVAAPFVMGLADQARFLISSEFRL
jgi:hypothetical protein